MIKIPKQDIERADAFKIPHLTGLDEVDFLIASKSNEYDNLRKSTFSRGRVFSFEKLQAYVANSVNGKVFFIDDIDGQFYCFSAANLYELNSIIYSGYVPDFCMKYDFDNDAYIGDLKRMKETLLKHKITIQ